MTPQHDNPAQPIGLPWRLAGENIVCFSTADWDTPLPTNKHHLMRRLARHNRVLFVETVGTRRPRVASGTDLGRIARRLRRAFEGPRRRAENLWTLSPVVRPAWRSTTARLLNTTAFTLQARAVLRRFPNPIVWVYSPYAVHLLRLIDPKLVVYHMVDDLSAVPGADREALREAEAQLLARADCVFCTERSLFDRAQLVTSRARLMPNVADYAHFSKPRASVRDERLERLRAMPRPRLLFSGNLAPHKVDLALLDELARLRPQFSFVLVGPEWEGADAQRLLGRLRVRPNVLLTGHVRYGDLPAYLHEADTLLIPYVRNQATRAVFPLKFFEYLATGRPVVASPLPSLLPFGEAVHLAEGREQWLAALERALASPGELADQRRRLARRNTWAARLRDMEQAIAEALAERHPPAP